MLSTDDDQLDPLEVQDLEEAHADSTDPATAVVEEDHAAPAADLDTEVVEEIEKVIAPAEEVPAKRAAHMLPAEMINRELDPEKDLFDDGLI